MWFESSEEQVMIRVASNTNVNTLPVLVKNSSHNKLTGKPLFVSLTPGNAIPKRQCNAPTKIILREIRSLRRHHLGSSG
jgi:hypothetical protein